MDERRQAKTGFWATVWAVVIAPFALYVGAYILLVEPVFWEEGYRFMRVLPATYVGDAYYCWPVGNEVTRDSRWPRKELVHQRFWQNMFVPLNALDRKIRPRTWEISSTPPR